MPWLAALFVAHTVATAVVHAEPPFVGTSSCAQFACHGRPVSTENKPWQQSYTVWATRDPHARAFNVLYSRRSAHMFQLLNSRQANQTGRAPENSEGIKPGEYLDFLERRCIGCHATPPPDPDSSIKQQTFPEESWSHGVSCESCHGSASSWVTEHTTTRWSDAPRQDVDRWGMRDTKSLVGRATTCVQCHIGPRTQEPHGTFDVDHDLIAAGHPKLSFELNHYLADLPAHWDRRRDEDRHTAVHGAKSFHFDAWRAGQWQVGIKTVEKLVKFTSGEAEDGAFRPPDFSVFDCYACHQRLRAPGTTRGARVFGADNQLRLSTRITDGIQMLIDRDERPEFQALSKQLAALFGGQRASQPLANGERRIVDSKLVAQLNDACRLASSDPLSDSERVQILVRLAEFAGNAETANWDRCVHLYLALVAFLEDRPEAAASEWPLVGQRDSLFKYLNTQFAKPQPTIYDSPDLFDPTSEEYQKRLNEIRATLQRWPKL